MVVFGDGRFHFPLIPFLALYAGWFVANARDIMWTRTRLVAALALVLVFSAVWHHEIGAAVARLSQNL